MGKKLYCTMGILDEGRQQPGTGTKPPAGNGQGGIVVVSMARTQREADDIIHGQLNAQGLVRGSKAYQEAMQEAWKTYNVSSLPIQ